MTEKYSVPALERANAVLNVISNDPYQWNLSELSRQLQISKSTLYSLLQTLERMQWVARDRHDTYALGNAMGRFVNAFARSYDLIEEFRRKAEPVMRRMEESIQLAKLEGGDVLYLAKIEAPSPVQMVSGPGVRFPAHATGLGKSLLMDCTPERLAELFPEEALRKITVHTLGSRQALQTELLKAREAGFSTDIQEGVMGFCCVAAPIRSPHDGIVAAVSCSMPIHNWEHKKTEAVQEILRLAGELSPVL